MTKKLVNENSNSLKLKFRFAIDGKERFSDISTKVEHSQGVVCFSLPFKLVLTVPNSYLLKCEQKEDVFIYIFEFESLNEAILFMEKRIVYVEQVHKSGDAYRIQKEMNDFMQIYEENEGRKKRRTKVIDKDGFASYR